MWLLASTFLNIALHRRGPEDLPASRFLFTIAVLCNFLVGVLSVSIRSSLTDAVWVVSLSVTLFLAFVAGMLSLFGKLSRFYQTTTAYAGADTVISLMGVPLLLWIQQSPPAEPPLLAGLLYWLLIIWSLEVFSDILSRSLEVGHWIAAAMVIAYFLFSYSLSSLVFTPTS